MNSNNFLVLDDHDGVQCPSLKFKHCDNEVILDPHLTLAQVVQRMKLNNLIDQGGKAEFFSPDGPRYASSCSVAEIMAFPFFRLRVDDWQDYHVVCQSQFGKSQASAVTSSELEFQNNAITNYGISLRKAEVGGRLFNFVAQRLENSN